jgi:BirA family transcriptional regulator, biotin operon repressor / biotin---[acetyl-CoA-carboxylase] ligase
MLTGAEPSFPPLLRGEDAAGDPFAKAVSRALTGADPGLVTYSRRFDALEAAVVLAPEQPLQRAIGVYLAAPVALGDAIGALAPPEVAVHYDWPGGIRVNGARCGRIRAAAATDAPGAVPDWLVLGVEVPFLPPEGVEGGETPDDTCLHAEGCGDVMPQPLLESWSRHLLAWINRFVDDGIAPLHAAWRARAWKMGEPLAEGSPFGPGVFMGLDENGGLLVKRPDGTALHPLTEALER